jgi:outer membrane protein assembly factor BamB
LYAARACLFVCALLLCTLTAAAAANSPASQFLPLVPRWSRPLPAPPAAAPIVVGGLVIVALQPMGVVALNASDGSPVWRVEIAAERPIAADDERVYVPTGGQIRALELKTGRPAWNTSTGNLTAPPLVHAGWLIAATPGAIGAFRAADGAAVWRRESGAIEMRPAIDGDLLFLPLLDRRVVALDLPSGSPRWETPLGGEPGEPLAVGGKVYVTAADKRFYALDADSGDIDWPMRIGAAPRGRAAADDAHVYLVAMDNVLRALDRGDGALEWKKSLAYRPSAGPVLVGGAVLIPGAVTTLPTFAPNGAALTPVTFPATPVAISNVLQGANGYPAIAAVTGDLQQPWTLWLLESSTDPPPIPLADLAALPGTTIAIVPAALAR